MQACRPLRPLKTRRCHAVALTAQRPRRWRPRPSARLCRPRRRSWRPTRPWPPPLRQAQFVLSTRDCPISMMRFALPGPHSCGQIRARHLDRQEVRRARPQARAEQQAASQAAADAAREAAVRHELVGRWRARREEAQRQAAKRAAQVRAVQSPPRSRFKQGHRGRALASKFAAAVQARGRTAGARAPSGGVGRGAPTAA